MPMASPAKQPAKPHQHKAHEHHDHDGHDHDGHDHKSHAKPSLLSRLFGKR